MKRKSDLYIGTSGWYYPHWDRSFYPEELPVAKRLIYYASEFSTVEINTTFYHLPSVMTVKGWKEKVPQNFLFSVKASRFITHYKRLKEPKEALKNFLERVDRLEEKLGPLLFQLPPSFDKDAGILKTFLAQLPKEYRAVFEFRHPSWFCEEIYEILGRRKCSLCISHMRRRLSPTVLNAPFIYIRLHGPEKSAYSGSYSSAQIRTWNQRIESFLEEGKDVFCYFDNDEKGYAIRDARRLKKHFIDDIRLMKI